MDAGKIVFSILMAGAQVFKQDAADVAAAQQKMGQTATDAAKKTTGLGDAQDQATAKTKAAKAPLDQAGAAAGQAGAKAGTAATGFKKAADAADQMGVGAQKAKAPLDAAAAAVEKAATTSASARAKEEAAASNVRAAESQLAEARQKYSAESSQVAKAEERLAAAVRQSEAAQEQAAAAARALADAEAEVASAAGAASPKVRTLRQEVGELANTSTDAAGAAQTVGTTFLGIGAGIAAFTIASVARFGDFDEGMSRVGAATMATKSELKDLGASAIEAGADTVFSAREAADAQTELAKAGTSVNDILTGGLNGSLALAAAGELEVARAAEIAATTMTVFGLKGKDAGMVADLLSAGAGKAQGSVDDLALALEYVGPTFARLNIPLDETVGTLALFASNGILGEKAGTGLRGVISSLTAPTKLGADTMKTYGINVFDAQGNFIGMEGVAASLAKGLGTLDEQTRSAALGAIFGAESANAAGVLYASGAEGVSTWTEKVTDAGFAQEQAFRMTDNLVGDIERLGGSFDAALIQTGSGANDVLREMVQLITGAIDWYSALPGPVQSAGLVIGVAAAAVALIGGAFLIAVPKVIEFRVAMSTLASTMPRTVGALGTAASFLGGPWGIAIGLAIAALAAFGGAQADSEAKTKAFGETIDETSHQITSSTLDMVKANLAAKQSLLWMEQDSVYDAAKKLGLSLDTVTAAAAGSLPDLQAMQKQLTSSSFEDQIERAEAAGMSLDDYTLAVNRVTQGVAGESDSIEQAIEISKQKTEADGEATEAAQTKAEASQTAAQAYLDEAEAANELLDQLTGLVEQINALNGINQDAVSANADFLESIEGIKAQFEDDWIQKQKDDYEAAHGSLDGYNESLEGFSANLDTNTAAGAANAASLAEVASKAQDAALAQYEVDKTTMGAKDATNKYIATLGTSKQAMIDGAIAAGGNADQVQALADKVFALPTQKEIDILADTSAAESAVEATLAYINSRVATITVNATNPNTDFGLGDGGINQADGGKVSFYANGGRESHIAQFARAGDWRVWAEPETGGEYYIPMAGSKRARSLQIAQQMVGEMGYQMVPLGAPSFASGSTPGAASARSSEPMRIVGKIDLGNGLTGLMDAQIEVAEKRRTQKASRGTNP